MKTRKWLFWLVTVLPCLALMLLIVGGRHEACARKRWYATQNPGEEKTDV